MPKLIKRNFFVGERGPRTSIELEDRMWEALREICMREDVSLSTLMEKLNASREEGVTLTSEVRAFALKYFQDAATEEGHTAANHGSLIPREG